MNTAKLFLFFFLSVSLTALTFAQVTSAGSGNWSEGATWIGGAVPSANANVVIANDHKVVLDADANCGNLTVDGTLEFENATARTLTITGNVVADSIKTSSLTGTGPLIHSIVLHGNLTVASLFDLRYGSNPNVGAADILITGSGNSTLSGPANMDVNGVTIDKSGAAKVILASNFFQNNNSSNFPLGILQLTNGVIETGNYMWHVKATGSSAGVQGGSNTSYVNGTLVRYMSSGAPVRIFQVGDGATYTPISVELTSATSNTPLAIKVVHGDANTGSSTFAGGIDKVSYIRYYEVTNLSNGPMNFRALAPSYGSTDGVASGNTDLRVAASVDNRTTWSDIGPSAADTNAHTTNVTADPTFIRSDNIPGNIVLASQTTFHTALAKVSGTGTNSLPVELTSFTAAVSGNKVELAWSTGSEKNNRGFEIERQSGSSVEAGIWEKIGFIAGFGTTTERKSYSFKDELKNAGSYSYRLKQIDFDGSFEYSEVVNAELSQPSEYQLMQNHPNPFNPVTNISFRITNPGLVSLKVFDVLGNEVSTLVNKELAAGEYQFEFNTSQNSGLTSGVYYYRLNASGVTTSFSETKKMIMLK